MIELDYKAVGEQIRCIRNQQNLSQEDLAEICNISPSYMGHIERGTRKMSLRTFVTIADALQVSCDYMLYRQMPESDEIIKSIIDTVKRNNEANYDKYISIIRSLSEIADRL